MDISNASSTANLLNNKPTTQPNLPTPAAGSNGFLKRHHHHPPTPPLPPAVPVSYKECLKNHAATTGGHALDGCGEFMPSSTSSLNCAACGCHRNFHRRREPDDPLQPSPTSVQHVIEYQPHHRHHPPPPPLGGGGHSSSPDSTSPPPISSSYYPSAPHMLLALSTGAALAVRAPEMSIRGRKRFRTKFRQDQKEKMQEFAEKVGWKMQKRDEEMISEFCRNVGVERNVLKVWMHNNKNNSINSSSDGKKENGGIDIHDHYHNDDPQLMIAANNGSSSSS
ncbi:zinc-finger homeodomain protein 8-like [Impatiens glandulifera]|uniref:zinc-finger homeodomain protein 8-like n=1 Tax=Impatiens glandulifera TaxID=253017 RepID=UPI001FB0BF5D|nr:zinc-finger homeodomain protein 8-like [Impatiens glandulifera]